MATTETANVGRAVAARVGTNIREVRTKLGLTQAQLASPEFSISYISAIERGKIRPSLKALSILAKRLDVPLTFLLQSSTGVSPPLLAYNTTLFLGSRPHTWGYSVVQSLVRMLGPSILVLLSRIWNRLRLDRLIHQKLQPPLS